MRLSVVINTKNMAETLEKTLVSVQSLAGEVVIVDMNSSDDTLSIAKKYTENIFHYGEDLGFADPARNFALSKAKGDWILVLDADEEIGSELAKLIQEVIDEKIAADFVADAYWIPRQNIIFGKKMQHTGWWPDYQLRLFKNGVASWTDKVHTPPQVKGKVIFFPAKEEFAILHHNYQTVDQYIDRLNRYTSLEVKSHKDEIMDFTTENLIVNFSSELWQRLFATKGIDEGLHGTSLSFTQAFYVMTTYLKQWEHQGFQPTHNDQKITLKTLKQFRSDLAYWMADWHVKNSSGPMQFIWQIRRKLKI